MKLTINDWGKMIGQKVIIQEMGQGIIKGVADSEILIKGTFIGWNNPVVLSKKPEDCSLILRSFDQMTEEEKKHRDKIEDAACCGCPCGEGICKASVVVTDYLDSIGIDQRGWIEKGLAVKEGEDEATKI